MKEVIENNIGEIIIYQSEDGKIKLDVRLENKTVWLTQEQIAQLRKINDNRTYFEHLQRGRTRKREGMSEIPTYHSAWCIRRGNTKPGSNAL